MINKSYITVTSGLRGYFAVKMWWNSDLGGYYEPWSTSPLSFKTSEEASQDGKRWAQDEGLEFR